MTKTRRFLGIEARYMPPTQKHRPAVWGNMLGTVYAMNDARQSKYFDYEHDAALEFSGAEEDGRDVRLYPVKTACTWHNGRHGSSPRKNQLVLWVKEIDNV